jgi:hypothetical protein
MTGKISLVLAIVATILFAGVGFLWLHFRSGSSQPVVAFTPITRAIESPSEAPESKEAKPISSSPSAETPAKKAPVEPVFSPKAGEVLQFSASLAKVSDVASLRLEVVDQKEMNGKPAWHFQATAKTQNAMRLIFDLDDRFDSFSEPTSFTGIQYEMHLSERGQKVQSVQRLTPTGKEPSAHGTSSVVVLPGTRDPLGMMQYLRSVNWNQTREVKSPVFDGRKMYDVRAKLIGTSQVVVPAGRYTAATIEIHVFDGNVEMKDAHFKLYLANDPARTPVLLLATLPFAEARVELQEKSE